MLIAGAASFFLIIKAAGSISLHLTARLQDENKIETDLIYDWGHLKVTCAITGQCEENDKIELVHKESAYVVKTVGCGPSDSSVSFDERIYQSLRLGNLACRHKRTDAWSNSLLLAYRICSDQFQFDECNTDTVGDTGTNPLFCILMDSGERDTIAHPSTPIVDQNWCGVKIPGKKICPANRDTLCEALVGKEYNKAFFRWPGECPDGEVQRQYGKFYSEPGMVEPGAHTMLAVSVTGSPLLYQGRAILYREPFAVYDHDRNVTFECPQGGPFYNRTVSFTVFGWKYIEFTLNAFQQNVTCQNSATFTLPATLFRVNARYFLGIYIASPNDSSSRAIEFLFENKLIVFAKVEVTQTETERFRVLVCEGWRTMDGKFGLIIGWTKKETGDKVIGGSPELEVSDPGEYKCHVHRYYGACDPRRRFVYNVSSDWFVIPPGRTTTGGGRSQLDHMLTAVMILAYWF